VTARQPEFSDAMAVSKTMAASVAANSVTNIATQVVSKTTKYQQSISLNNNYEPTSDALELCKLDSIRIKKKRQRETEKNKSVNSESKYEHY